MVPLNEPTSNNKKAPQCSKMSRQNDGERIRGITNSLVVRHGNACWKFGSPISPHFDSWKGPWIAQARSYNCQLLQATCLYITMGNKHMKYTSLYHVLAFMNCSWDTQSVCTDDMIQALVGNDGRCFCLKILGQLLIMFVFFSWCFSCLILFCMSHLQRMGYIAVTSGLNR